MWPAVIRRHRKGRLRRRRFRRGGEGQAPTADAGKELEDFPREIMDFIGETCGRHMGEIMGNVKQKHEKVNEDQFFLRI